MSQQSHLNDTGAAGREAQTLPLCFATPLCNNLTHHFTDALIGNDHLQIVN